MRSPIKKIAHHPYRSVRLTIHAPRTESLVQRDYALPGTHLWIADCFSAFLPQHGDLRRRKRTETVQQQRKAERQEEEEEEEDEEGEEGGINKDALCVQLRQACVEKLLTNGHRGRQQCRFPLKKTTENTEAAPRAPKNHERRERQPAPCYAFAPPSCLPL